MAKIGIMGTHGIGKTTFAFNLATQLKKSHMNDEVKIVREVVRSCPFDVNEDTTQLAQRWIFHQQMVKEIEADKAKFIICDRTIIDNLAYAWRAGFYSFVEKHLEIALEWLQTYRSIYFLRPNDRYLIGDDDFRSGNRDFQLEIDHILVRWVAIWMKDIPLIEGTLDDFIGKEVSLSVS